MKLILEIDDEDTKDQVRAAGAEDLRAHHFPQMMGIKARKVTITTEDEIDMEKYAAGEECRYVRDESEEP